jgi:hypothetical protein
VLAGYAAYREQQRIAWLYLRIDRSRKRAMSQQADPPSNIYRICIRSVLDEGWVRALQIHPVATHRYYSGPPRTVLTLQLIDQAELLGLLNRLHNMGLTLLSVELSLPNTT